MSARQNNDAWARLKNRFLDAFVSETAKLIVACIFTVICALCSLFSLASIYLGIISFLPWMALVMISAKLMVTIRELAEKNEMLEGVGLRGFSPHNDKNSRKQNWDNFVDELNSKDYPNNISILGASGSETFGRRQSYLYDFLNNFKGVEIKILLLKPYSDGFASRVHSLGTNNTDESSYAREIEEALSFCKQLANSGKKISVRLYEDMPIWKMIFADDRLWLQYYRSGTHVDLTSVYMFQSRRNIESSLYYPLYTVFERRWTLDSTTHLDDLENMNIECFMDNCRKEANVKKKT